MHMDYLQEIDSKQKSWLKKCVVYFDWLKFSFSNCGYTYRRKSCVLLSHRKLLSMSPSPPTDLKVYYEPVFWLRCLGSAGDTEIGRWLCRIASKKSIVLCFKAQVGNFQDLGQKKFRVTVIKGRDFSLLIECISHDSGKGLQATGLERHSSKSKRR